VSVSCMAPVLSTAHQRDLSHSEGLRKKPTDPPAPRTPCRGGSSAVTVHFRRP
jgi:hypothetical protein